MSSPRQRTLSTAQRAITAMPEVGVLLPCNVVLRTIEPGTTRVDIADPLLFTADEIVADLPGLHILRAARLIRDVGTDSGRRTAVDTLVVAVAPGRSATGASPDAISSDVRIR